jgi:polysaccharide biosynthesis protein PslG
MAVLALAASACGGESGDGRVGLSTHLTFGAEPLAPALREMREGGIAWIREDFLWDRIELEPGRFDWGPTDRLMAAAAAEGIAVLPIIDYAARWASSDPGGDVHHPPRDPGQYAAFARAVVARYGPGGEFWEGREDAVPLRAIELWNEPWGHFFWKPEPDPAAYARLARAAAAAVRDASADVDVLVSADLLQVRGDGAPLPWFEALLDADSELPELVDGWTVHPYPGPRDRGPSDGSGDVRFTFGRVTETAAIARRRDAERPLWITEIGWSTAATDEGVSEEEQAQHLGAALDRALGDWRDLVRVTFVYGWDRDNGSPDDLEGHFGVRRADGSFKPAWEAVVRRADG